VQVIVNGEHREVDSGETVFGLLKALEIEADRVAIELDRRIVKRAQWEETLLRDGAQLEIVQFVGGG